MKNILITSAGKRVVLVQIFQRTLKELGIEAKVYAVDMKPELSPACIIADGSFAVPSCNAPDYIDRLLEICKNLNVGVIIPTIDKELLLLSASRTRFEEVEAEVAMSDIDFIKVCRDKRLTEAYLAGYGIKVPRTVDKYHPVFPMFAKPYDGSRSKNIHVIKNQDELTKEILEDPKLLFMEYISKQDYKEFTVDMYYGKDCNVKGIVPRERIEIRAGEVNKGITRKNYLISYLKERMAHLDGVHGCICIQLFYREQEHDVKGIEINPRFGGGFPLSYYAKANFVENVIREYLMGEQIDYSDSWLDNTLMLRYDNDVIVYDAEA